jgi:hypothetical protein
MSLLDSREDFQVAIHPAADWSATREVSIDVLSGGSAERIGGASGPRMPWDAAKKQLVTRLSLNEHQIDALSRRLNRGQTLNLKIKCDRSDLLLVGFLKSDTAS